MHSSIEQDPTRILEADTKQSGSSLCIALISSLHIKENMKKVRLINECLR